MPKSILKRFQKHVSDALSLKDFRLLVFFQNGTVKLHSLKAYFQTQPEFGILLRKPEFFPMWKVLPGGFGISLLGCRYESVLRLAVPQWKVTARSYRCLSRFCSAVYHQHPGGSRPPRLLPAEYRRFNQTWKASPHKVFRKANPLPEK